MTRSLSISLEGIELRGRCGVTPEERMIGQTLAVDVRLEPAECSGAADGRARGHGQLRAGGAHRARDRGERRVQAARTAGHSPLRRHLGRRSSCASSRSRWPRSRRPPSSPLRRRAWRSSARRERARRPGASSCRSDPTWATAWPRWRRPVTRSPRCPAPPSSPSPACTRRRRRTGRSSPSSSTRWCAWTRGSTPTTSSTSASASSTSTGARASCASGHARSMWIYSSSRMWSPATPSSRCLIRACCVAPSCWSRSREIWGSARGMGGARRRGPGRRGGARAAGAAVSTRGGLNR